MLLYHLCNYKVKMSINIPDSDEYIKQFLNKSTHRTRSDKQNKQSK